MENNTPQHPTKAATTATASSDQDPGAAYKSNPEIDARIDSYIRDNPRHWAYIQSMSRERLERSVVLAEVRQIERQQRVRDNVMRNIDRNPQLKQAYDTLVKDLPEDQRESVITQLARTRQRVIGRGAESRSGQRV